MNTHRYSQMSLTQLMMDCKLWRTIDRSQCMTLYKYINYFLCRSMLILFTVLYINKKSTRLWLIHVCLMLYQLLDHDPSCHKLHRKYQYMTHGTWITKFTDGADVTHNQSSRLQALVAIICDQQNRSNQTHMQTGLHAYTVHRITINIITLK